jgi:hypothetical protein
MPNVTEMQMDLAGKITFELDDGTTKVVDLANLPAGGGGGSVTADSITDAGTSGKAVLRASTVVAIKTVLALVKADVGLANVDNTSDANKPVSTATQNALDLKAPIASPAFTGTVSGVTSAMVGLGNVNNTSDANKPVSTAQQTALNLKADSSAVASSLALKSDKTTVVAGTALGTRNTTDADDAGVFTTASAITVTIHSGAKAGFGFYISGAGVVTVAGAGGVTVTDKRTIGATNPVAAVVQIGVNAYEVIGSKA